MTRTFGAWALRVALLALSAAGCLTSIPQVASTFCRSQLISAEKGGTVIVTGQDSPGCPELAGTRLVIPPHALAQDTILTVTPGHAALALPWANAVGPVVALGPSGTHFSYAATVTLPFDVSMVPEPYRLFVQVVEGNGLAQHIEHRDLDVALAARTLSFPIRDFTEFEVDVDDTPCHQCPPTYVCEPITGSCICDTSHYACVPGGECVDLRSDSANCGSCGNACDPGFTCDFSESTQVEDAGARCACLPGRSGCVNPLDGGLLLCVDLASDNDNCGRCGNVCPPGVGCDGHGMCTRLCIGGYQLCAPGHCVDTLTDTNNCGSCGVVCPAGCCNGACADLARDTTNCGVCGNACAGVQDCCGSTCTDLETDAKNCGSCGTICRGDQICIGGGCCDTVCGECPTDPNNCGSCRNVCGGQTPGCCSSVCVDFNRDEKNCGSCGHACAPCDVCHGGHCMVF